jgi:hypothetical protein
MATYDIALSHFSPLPIETLTIILVCVTYFTTLESNLKAYKEKECVSLLCPQIKLITSTMDWLIMEAQY